MDNSEFLIQEPETTGATLGRLGFDLGLELEPDDSENLPVRLDNAPGVWNPRMVFDVALGVESDDVIRERYGLSEWEYQHILNQPAFKTEMGVHCKTLRETGVTFATKAKLIAEETLEEMFTLITSNMVDPKVRVSAWSKMVDAAGLAPEKSSAAGGGNAPQVNIQINL